MYQSMLKKYFNSAQMFEIREGLKANLDVNLYADKKYNEHQMSQIRLGLENNLDISLICKNFDNSHISSYYSVFRLPPIDIFFKQQKKYSF